MTDNKEDEMGAIEVTLSRPIIQLVDGEEKTITKLQINPPKVPFYIKTGSFEQVSVNELPSGGQVTYVTRNTSILGRYIEHMTGLTEMDFRDMPYADYKLIEKHVEEILNPLSAQAEKA